MAVMIAARQQSDDELNCGAGEKAGRIGGVEAGSRAASYSAGSATCLIIDNYIYFILISVNY